MTLGLRRQNEQMIPVHDVPVDRLFRVYVKSGLETRVVLWFRCSNNGDLVAKALSSGRNLHEVKGKFDHGIFKPITEPEKLQGLTGDDQKDHLHLTIHPSIKKPSCVLNGIMGRKHTPRFDLKTFDRLQQVVVHLLATPQNYSIAKPDLQKDGGKFHAVLGSAYGLGQPRIIFWVAPISRVTVQVANADVLPDCFFYGRVSPSALSHDLLLQVQLDTVPYSQYGDMHILAAPVADAEEK
jgi:hypothetical protein